MPLKYVSEGEQTQIIERLINDGYQGAELGELAGKIVSATEEDRAKTRVESWGIPRQVLWSAGKGLQLAGETATAALGYPFGLTRNPIEVFKAGGEKPYTPQPSAVKEEAPTAAKIALPMAGHLAVMSPLFGLAGKAVGAVAEAGMKPIAGARALTQVGRTLARPAGWMAMKHPLLTQVAQSAGVMEALSRAEGAPAGQGAMAGVAMSLGPAFLRRFPRFQPAVNPYGLNLKALPAVVQRGAYGASAVAGLTARDLLAGRSIPEQFDVRSPEGMASLMDKGFVFGLTATHGLAEARRLDRIKRRALEAQTEAGRIMLDEQVKPEMELYRARMLTPREMTQEEIGKTMQQANDVSVLNLLRRLKVKVPQKMFSEIEIERRKSATIRDKKGTLRVNLDALNEDKPDREIFMDESSRFQAMEMAMDALGGSPKAYYNALARELKAGETMLQLAKDNQKNLPLIPPRIAGAKEGPVYDRSSGKWNMQPVTLNESTPDQRQVAARFYRYFEEVVRKHYGEVADPKPTVEAWRRQTLQSLYGEEVGDMVYRAAVTGKKPLHELIPAEDYGEFVKLLPGNIARIIRGLSAEFTARTGVVQDVSTLLVNSWETLFPALLRDNAPADRVVRSTAISHYFRPPQKRFDRWTDAHPEDPLGPWYHAMSNQYYNDLQMKADVDGMNKAIWVKHAPPELRGPHGAGFRDQLFLRVDPEAAKKAGIEPKSMADVAKEAGRGWSPEMLEKAMAGIVPELKVLTDAGFSQSGLPASRHLKHYIPLMMTWHKAGMPGKFEDYAVKQGLNLQEARNFESLMRRMSDPPYERVFGKKEPSFSKERTLKTWVDYITFENDPIVALRRYTQQLGQLIYKEPMLAYTKEVMETLRRNHGGQPDLVARLEKSMRWYLESWWGVPSSIDRYMEGAHPYALGLDWLRNKVPFLRKETPDPTKGYAGRGTARALDFLTTASYGATMGFKARPVLKNFIQQGHNWLIFGSERCIEGWVKLMIDPKFHAEAVRLKKMARLEYLDMPEQAVGAIHKGLSKIVRASLAPFQLVDAANTYGAIAPAMIAFRRMEAVRKAGAGHELQLEKLLLRRLPITDRITRAFRKSPALSERFKNTWDGSGSLGKAIMELMDQGRVDEAKRAYTQWAVWTGQWSYGTPEQAPFFRGSFNRVLGQYKSWWVNEAEMISAMANHRMGREWLRMLAMWGGMGALSMYLGAPIYKWLGSGSFPTDPLEIGPAGKTLLLPYTLAKRLADSFQDWLFVDDEDVKVRSPEEVILDLLDEFQRRNVQPFVSQFEAVTGERPLQEWVRGERMRR